MGQSLCGRGFTNCVAKIQIQICRERCQRAVDEQPQGQAPTAVATRTRATARVAVVSPQGTATPMPMAPLTTTMGPATASTTLHLVEQSLLVARLTPPTSTTMLGQLPPRPNSLA